MPAHSTVRSINKLFRGQLRLSPIFYIKKLLTAKAVSSLFHFKALLSEITLGKVLPLHSDFLFVEDFVNLLVELLKLLLGVVVYVKVGLILVAYDN